MCFQYSLPISRTHRISLFFFSSCFLSFFLSSSFQGLGSVDLFYLSSLHYTMSHLRGTQHVKPTSFQNLLAVIDR
ncbi:hypothetical protein F4778DRAFT_701373 [Xylariomycetidae sp. FL2044]|nr:hypothetical protein F4778DRAFT_701373 [Xylariomycetidae sp. FL2044]